MNTHSQSLKEPVCRAGWRYFRCEDCGHLWKQTTRDCDSPSGENCPRCGEWWFPYLAERDATIVIDELGSLVLPPPPERTPNQQPQRVTS